MNAVDVGELIVAIIAVIISIISLVKSIKGDAEMSQLREKQLKLEQGEAESTIRTMITHASERMQDVAAQLSRDKDNPLLLTAFNSADENYRNAYEEACARYLDGKVDKERFKKMYGDEIKQLVEGDAEKNFYSGNQSRYSSTLKVYKDWYRQA